MRSLLALIRYDVARVVLSSTEPVKKTVHRQDRRDRRDRGEENAKTGRRALR